jgi:hypothetical protein
VHFVQNNPLDRSQNGEEKDRTKLLDLAEEYLAYKRNYADNLVFDPDHYRGLRKYMKQPGLPGYSSESVTFMSA